MPVILATAYAAELPEGFMEGVRPAAVLHKPVEPKDLLAAVRSAAGGVQ